jgi:hypothetical protein
MTMVTTHQGQQLDHFPPPLLFKLSVNNCRLCLVSSLDVIFMVKVPPSFIFHFLSQMIVLDFEWYPSLWSTIDEMCSLFLCFRQYLLTCLCYDMFKSLVRSKQTQTIMEQVHFKTTYPLAFISCALKRPDSRERGELRFKWRKSGSWINLLKRVFYILY